MSERPTIEPDDGYQADREKDRNQKPWEHYDKQRDKYCEERWPGLFGEVTK